ncbi:XrtA/PEP-CTERM system TPR-repeat protein PrsT [Thalassotalea profundi]|uniref:PEP-CTERM system TPR-repeat protein PrsT n=1 Tax=Thalassotalea profundi TaxID=2036687 RepID=A0ABQ3INK7_9GAMM|nr:XrtA/PEP-CTERM system TPR-repeat protein PrsT [Thalassotalea profundi]GHE89550.1 hypothetical protein GCM10011501_18900 [Thalassotalea profundi]
MYIIKKSKGLVPLLLVVLAVIGCSGKKSDEEYLSLAKTSMDKGETSAAIINLKNVLSVNSQSIEARFLLGKSYLSLGLWISAGKELEIAYTNGYDTSQVIPLLAKSYYHLGDIQGLEELIAQIDLLSQETQTILKTFTALTYIKEEVFEQGIIYLYDVVEVNYDSKYTKLSQAWKYGMDDQLSDAIAVIDDILNESPDFAEAIEYNAYLYFKEQDMAKAAEYFGKYIAIHPQAHELRMMYALALVYSEQYEAGEQQTDLLLKGMPKNPKLNQIKAQTRFAANDYEQAKQFAEVAIRGDNKLVLSKVIAGISAYQLKQLEVAYSHLNSVSADLNYQHPAKKILNALKFQLGYEDDVFNELSSVNNTDVDVNVLGTSAQELFKLGKIEEANSLLEKAAKKDPENADVLYQQGMFKLFNKDETATTFFEKALEKNPELESAMSMLLLERLKEGDYEKAFEIANNVASENPELAFTYKGVIYFRQGDLAKSKKEFEQALSLNNENAGVHFKLGQVYEAEKNTDKAIEQYQQALNININSPLVASSLLNLSKNEDYKETVEEYFQQLVDKNDREYIAHVYLASFYIVRNEFNAAQLALTKGLERNPNNFQLLMLKGKVQAHSKDYSNALVSFNEALKLNPYSPATLIAKANVFELQGNLPEAINSQKEAIKLIPNEVSLKLGLANLHIKNRELPAAASILSNLKLSGKENINIERLLGKIAFLNNDFDKARNILSNVYQKLQSEDVVFELSTSLQQLKRSAEAIATIEKYKSNNKVITSLDLLLKYAELLEKDKPEAALDIYNTILSQSDRHFAMLNNAAMIHLKLGNTEKALSLAKEALDKAPNMSAIQNTYGLTLLSANKNSDAEKYLKQASVANLKNDNYKVHYAMALFANNKKDEAKGVISNINLQDLNEFTLPKYNELVDALGL